MIVSHSNRFIFFKPLKVAGTSIEAFLSHVCDEDDLITGSVYEDDILAGYCQQNNLDENNGSLRFHSHTYPELLYKITGSLWSDYTKISAMRNPWDMCVSYYWWCVWNKDTKFEINSEDNKSDILRKFRKWLLSPMVLDDGNVSGKEVFPTAVDFLARETNRFIRDDIGFYIKFETLNDDMKKICKIMDLEFSGLQKLKSSQRSINYHYSHYYDFFTQDIVEQRFNLMIEKFNYKFEKK